MSLPSSRIGGLTAVAIAALAVAAPSAMAADRNHDRIPDSWEKANRLSLKTNQAKKDQDKDGLKNRGEYLAGFDPRDADTDGDGTADGDEGAGRITEFAGGKLTVDLFAGTTVKAYVNDTTEILCEPAAPAADPDPDTGATDTPATTGATSARRGGHGPDGPPPAWDDWGDDGDDGDGPVDCDTTELTVGRVVEEGDLRAGGRGLSWQSVLLRTPADTTTTGSTTTG